MPLPPRLRLMLFTYALWALVAVRSQAVEATEAPAENHAAVTTLEIGGVSILIPPPPGFERSDGISSQWDKEIGASVSASNRLLASFLTTEDTATLRAGRFPTPQRSFAIQVLKSYETKDVDDQDFLTTRNQIHQGLEKPLAQIQEKLKNATDKDTVEAALMISDTALMGIFDDTPHSFGFTLALNNHKEAIAANQGKVIVAAMVMLIKGRMISLYSHAQYKSPQDREWAEMELVTWRDAISAENLPKPAVAERPHREGMGGGTALVSLSDNLTPRNFAIAGGVCLAVLAIALFLFVQAAQKARRAKSPKAGDE